MNTIILMMLVVLALLFTLSIIGIAMFRKDGCAFHNAQLREDYSVREKRALLVSHRMLNISICVLVGAASAIIATAATLIVIFVK